MAATEAFEFYQEDLLSASFTMFYDMKNRGELSDVTIRIENRAFTAHRIVLAAAVPYFHAMFTSKMAESEVKEVTVKDLDPAALEGLIDFVYTSKVNITSENVQSLLIASEFLQLTKVRDTCCDFLSKRLAPNNVIQVRALAESLNCLCLVDSCDSYMRQHFNVFCQAKEFLSLPFSFLNELIRRDDLKVKSEERVFEALMCWIKTDTKRHSVLSQLLTGVRMTRLSPQFLIKKASKKELILESFTCRNLLDEAKHYHLLPEDRPSYCSFTLAERCREEHYGMYLFSCSSSTGLTVLKYISDTNTWSTLLNDTTRGDLRHVLALGNLVYVFRNNNIFEAFNPLTLQWTALKKHPSSHSPFKCVVPCDKRIYWFADNRSMLDTVYFDVEQNVWCHHDQGPLLIDAELVSYRKSIYILGGLFDMTCTRSSKVYDPQENKTTAIRDMVCSRSDFRCAVLDGKIYVCGGTRYVIQNSFQLGFPAPFKSTEEYNPSDGHWREVSEMNAERKNFSLVSYNKKLYAFGGETPNGGTTGSIECYDPVTNKWTSYGIVSAKYNFLKVVVTSSEND